MKSFINQAKNEEGSVVIVALLILVFLTLIGISATTTTQIELQIAGNEKSHKIAFYNADSGVYATPKLISACVDNSAEQNLPGILNPTAFYRQVMGYDAYDSANDIQFTLGGFNVDVNRTGAEALAGGGVEFASGAEGIGVGSAGGTAIVYDMNSFGSGPSSSLSRLGAIYRKVVGVPGGL
jgi:hypothetical protein